MVKSMAPPAPANNPRACSQPAASAAHATSPGFKEWPDTSAPSRSLYDDDDFYLFLQKHATIMSLMVLLPSCPLWYYDDPFIPVVDVVVR
jgi:hypothetical protein